MQLILLFKCLIFNIKTIHYFLQKELICFTNASILFIISVFLLIELKEMKLNARS